MKNASFICKLALFAAILTLLVGVCAIAMADTHIGEHTWDSGVKVEDANCDHPARYKFTCTVCGATKYDYVGTSDPSKHDWGDWVVKKAATCTEAGERVRTCKNNPHHTETDYPAKLGHNLGDWVTIKSPTCTEDGTKRRSCSRCTYYENETISALNHDWGPEVVKAATCTTTGSITRTCRRDSSHVQSTTIPIDPNAHQWGEYVTVKKPNCTYPGQKTRTCKLNSAHTDSVEIPIDPNAHQWDKGTIIVKPTLTSPGKKLYVCQINSAHTKEENIAKLTMGNNTVCAFGPRLRDVNLYPYDTDLWYMFTPFDASQDGVQTYELVASNKLIVGNVTLTIKEGNLTIDYTLNDTANFAIDLEFFTVLNRINDLTQYEPEELMNMRWNKKQAYNLAETFGDDTSLVLYFCSRCTYSDSSKYIGLNYDSNAHRVLLQRMLDLMD